jgi:hypothetical protein
MQIKCAILLATKIALVHCVLANFSKNGCHRILSNANTNRVGKRTMDFFENYSEDLRSRLEEIKHDSTSQIGADLFVLAETNFKENGYFVDFGASDGISSSNTQLLENKFAWKGILAEPNLFFIDKLRQNRPNAVVVDKAVWKLSNEVLVFNETNNKDFSTIDLFSNSDWRCRRPSQWN